MELWKPNFWIANCLIWALKQEERYGGHVISRQSLYGNYRHYLWVCPKSGKKIGFIPRKEWLFFDNLRLPTPLFKGKLVEEEWTVDDPKHEDHIIFIEIKENIK